MTKVKRARILAEKTKPYICKCGKAFATKDYLRKHTKNKTSPKRHDCPVDGCDFKCKLLYNMRVHMRTHTGEKPFACTVDGCGFKCTTSGSLRTHMMTHTGEKPFSCTIDGCDYRSNQSGNLCAHMRTHKGEKPFACTIDGCDFRSNQLGNLRRHMMTHTGEKPFACTIDGCDFKSNQLGNLRAHMRAHTGEKPFACMADGCGFKCTISGNLRRHMMTHTGEKPFSCTIDGCDYMCTTSRDLRTHMMTHTGKKPFACTIDGCDFRSTSSSGLRKHMRTHTLQGQIRRKKQENRVNKLLKEWGYTADPEVTINVSRNKCVEDTQRFYSRLDFTIVNCVNAMLILEVDEDQHLWYNLSCEFSRMSDIRASLVAAGYEIPIYWIRYNPNGKYHVGSDHVKIARPRREEALKAKMEELCSLEFVPEKQVNIHYMFYDLISNENGPSILMDSDFPEVLEECVTWHVSN